MIKYPVLGSTYSPGQAGFSQCLSAYELNSQQAEFIRLFKAYFQRNGYLDLASFQVHPFKSLGSISQIFQDDHKDDHKQFKQVVTIVKRLNQTAEVA